MEESLNQTKVINLYNKRKEIFLIEAVRAEDGVIIQKPEEIKKTVRSLCLNMYKPIEIDDGLLRTFLNYKFDIDAMPTKIGDKIQESEVIAAIKQLNLKKSPGKDGLPSKFYHACSLDLSKLLTQVFN